MLTITIPDDASIALTAAQVVEVRNDAAASAITEANSLREQLATRDKQAEEFRQGLIKMTEERNALLDENKRLSDELAALKAPVVVPVPEVPTPEQKFTLTKTTMRGVCQVTITKDDTPGDKQDAIVREILQLCKGMGFTHWRGLLNYEEARSTISLPALGRECGMEFIADTIDSQMKRADMNDGKLRVYLEQLKKHGARALYINDADEPAKAPFLQDWLKRIRSAMQAAEFDVPIIGSFTALFDMAKYPGFDFYEIQCFGTPEELRTFLAREDVDVWCLDTRKNMSTARFQQRVPIILDAKPENIALYTAFDYSGTDWRQMGELMPEVKTMIQKWNAAR